MITSASKESAQTDEVKVTIEYHGRTYTSTRKVTLALLLIEPDALIDQAKVGAERCMKQALAEAKKEA